MSTSLGPEKPVINGVTWGHYKWPYKWVCLGLFHPYNSIYNWIRGPVCRDHRKQIPVTSRDKLYIYHQGMTVG